MRSRKISLLSITLVALVNVGCSSGLSKKECQNADWYIIGMEDGSKGLPLDKIGRHREACAKSNIVPDLQRYQEGLNSGYKTYCTRANGYQIGKNGRTHQNVCTGDAGAVFSTAYNDGKEWHKLRLAQGKIENELEEKRNSITGSRNDISNYESRIVDRMTTEEQRRKLLQDIKDRELHISNTNILIKHLSEDQWRAQDAVQDLEAKHKSLGY